MAAKKKLVKKATKKAVSKTPKTTVKQVKKVAKKKVATKKSTAKSKAAPKNVVKTTATKPVLKKKVAKAAKKSSVKSTKAAKASKPKAVVKKSAKAVKSPEVAPVATFPAKTKKAKFKRTPFVKKQHKRLLDLRDQFIVAIKGISHETLRNNSGNDSSGSGMHQGDAGSDAYDRDYALSILAKEQDALYEIERALHRLETGTYGICQMSGEAIPTIRLEVLPFARLTVECQTLWENKFGKKRYTIREGAAFTEQR